MRIILRGLKPQNCCTKMIMSISTSNQVGYREATARLSMQILPHRNVGIVLEITPRHRGSLKFAASPSRKFFVAIYLHGNTTTGHHEPAKADSQHA